MVTRASVELIAVGNEILMGMVLDTNTNWLCKRITGLGGRVERAAVVRDELDAIADAVSSAARRGCIALFISGGLGPTADDMTLKAVARALGREMEMNQEALKMVADRYEELAALGMICSGGMSKDRRKMALLPSGGAPLANHVGTAPGVVLRQGESTIICLPGVPEEMMDIFDESLQPHLKELFGKACFMEWTLLAETNDESLLAPVLRRVAENNPGIYLKSRAKAFSAEGRIRVTLSASGRSGEEVETALRKGVDELRSALKKRLGISISLQKEGDPS